MTIAISIIYANGGECNYRVSKFRQAKRIIRSLKHDKDVVNIAINITGVRR